MGPTDSVDITHLFLLFRQSHVKQSNPTTMQIQITVVIAFAAAMAAGQFVGPQYAYPGLRYPDNGLRYPFPSPLLPSGALLGARAPLLPQAPLLQPAPLPIVAAPLRPLPEEVYPSKPFRFGYNIRDDLTANDQAHQQESDGVATVGSYRVNLPDGRVQVVTYRADVNGYVADVQYEGVPIYPEGPLPIVN